ncbi:MAG: TlyA family RNA methyltransferase [bacterium]
MKLKNKKQRLDSFLVSKNFFQTKNQAQAAVLAGLVKINDKTVSKAGMQISQDVEIKITAESLPYVSRGGLKLEKALKIFNINVNDKICLDIGASTGGFSDCLLQNQAKKIYAVDVGYGQLAWKLRNNEKIIVVERTNIRNASFEQIYKDIKDIEIKNSSIFAEFATIDLSFISVTKVLQNIKFLMNQYNQEIIILIKPQFEAGKTQVKKGGVVKDKEIHVNVIKQILEFACTLGIYPVDLTYSPVKGPAGNIEYLVYIKNDQNYSENYLNQEKIKAVVDESYEFFLQN